jgi:transposase
MRVAEAIELDAKTTSELLTLSKGRRVEARVQQRASVILLAAQGWQNKDIAQEVRLDRRQVALWRRRFTEGGLPALLQDASRSGRTPRVTPEVESHILRTTLHEPPAAAAHWSTRTLASHLGLSATTIGRVWRRNGIQPRLNVPFNLSAELPLRFDDELVDVVGLYMNPREHVLVLSCAAKGHVATSNRAEPEGTDSLTAKPPRQGTTALLAALRKLESAVVSVCQDRHRHEEWLRFLRLVDRQTPKHLRLHLIVENQATHKRSKVQAWLAQHPRLVVHSTPANASWLNVVRRLLREISEHRIRHGSFTSTVELQQAMAQYIDRPAKEPKPFAWTVNAPDTAQVTRTKAAMARWTISTEQNGALQHEADVTTAWA